MPDWPPGYDEFLAGDDDAPIRARWRKIYGHNPNPTDLRHG